MKDEFIESSVNNYNVGTIICNSEEVLNEDEKDIGIAEDCIIDVKGLAEKEKIEKLLMKESEKTWTHIFIPGTLKMPDKNPDIEKIISFSCYTEIINKTIIKTPVLKVGDEDKKIDISIKNAEGLVITGRRLVLEGILKQKLIYTSSANSKSLHSAIFDILFAASIVLPVDTFVTTQYNVDTYIEDIRVNKKGLRELYCNASLFIKASQLAF